MKCKFESREAFIEKYLREELSESEESSFEEHFFSCKECFNELETMKQMMEMIEEEGDVLFPEFKREQDLGMRSKPRSRNFIKKLFPPILSTHPEIGYAVIIALVVIVGLYILGPFGRYKNDPTLPAKGVISEKKLEPQNEDDSLKGEQIELKENIQIENLYAANFVESDNLEYLLNQQYRGNGFIAMLSPEIGGIIKDEVLFSWKTDIEEEFYLKILNNKEDVLHKLTAKQSPISINIKEKNIEPGLYYWKLESSEELLLLGKFIINE